MKKRLSDEIVAKALGWHYEFWGCPGLPEWTTSLDAIVVEIEARGLRWSISRQMNHGDGFVAQVFSKETHPHEKFSTSPLSKTAPLALCAALLAYLKTDGGKS